MAQAYEQKWDGITNDSSVLSVKDILWLDNLAYFRHLAANYADYKTIEKYLEDIGDQADIKDGILRIMRELEAAAGYNNKDSNGQPILPLDFSENELESIYQKLCNNPSIQNLEIVNAINLDEIGLVGYCYKQGGNVYVIFRGTSGPDACLSFDRQCEYKLLHLHQSAQSLVA